MSSVFTDMMGREVMLPGLPKRIVSVVPSQTELLFDLGLEEEVVGITKFCVHPERWFRTKQRVGGTKTLNLDLIRSLQPDLIIANKEENEREQIETLAQEFPVWVSDISDLEAALRMIGAVGKLTGREKTAASLREEIESGFRDISAGHREIRVAYFIWYRPWMTVGNDTSIHHVLERLGMRLEARLREHEWIRGEPHDELLYGILAEEWRSRP